MNEHTHTPTRRLSVCGCVRVLIVLRARTDVFSSSASNPAKKSNSPNSGSSSSSSNLGDGRTKEREGKGGECIRQAAAAAAAAAAVRVVGTVTVTTFMCSNTAILASSSSSSFFHTKRAYVESKLLLASPPKVSRPALVYRGYGEAVRALLASSSSSSSSRSPSCSNRAVARAGSSFSRHDAEEPEHFSMRSAEVSIANARGIRHCDHSPLIDRNEGKNGAHYLSLLIHRSADQVRCRITFFFLPFSTPRCRCGTCLAIGSHALLGSRRITERRTLATFQA